MAPEVPGRRRQPRRSRGAALRLHSPDPSQWKSARTTNAIERLNEEFRRRIKTQTVLLCADTLPMLLWALLPPARSPCAKSTDGRPSPSSSGPSPLTTPPDQAEIAMLGERRPRISTNSRTRPGRFVMVESVRLRFLNSAAQKGRRPPIRSIFASRSSFAMVSSPIFSFMASHRGDLGTAPQRCRSPGQEAVPASRSDRRRSRRVPTDASRSSPSSSLSTNFCFLCADMRRFRGAAGQSSASVMGALRRRPP